MPPRPITFNLGQALRLLQQAAQKMGSGGVPLKDPIESGPGRGGGSYSRVPDSLMGFNKGNGPNKGYYESKYPYSLKVRMQFADGSTHEDEIKGMNPAHALERARRNWPAAISIEPIQ